MRTIFTVHKACEEELVGRVGMLLYLCIISSGRICFFGRWAVQLGGLILTWGGAFVIYAEVICFPLLYCEFCTTFGNS